MFGNGRTVIRGHYGRYFDGAKANYYNLVNGTEPAVWRLHRSGHAAAAGRAVSAEPGHVDRDGGRRSETAAARSVHHRLRARAVSELLGRRERHLPRQQGLHRGHPGQSASSRRSPSPIPGPTAPSAPRTTPGSTLTFYDQLSDQADDRFFVTNPDDAFRRYRGLELTANKRFTDRLDAPGVVGDFEDHRQHQQHQLHGNSVEYRRSQPGSRASSRSAKAGWDATTRTSRRCWAPYRSPFGRHDVGRVLLHDRRHLHPDRSPDGSIRERSICSPKPRGSNRLDGQPKFDMKFEKRFRAQRERRAGAHRRELQPVQQRRGRRPRSPSRVHSSASRRALWRRVRGGLEESSASRRTNEAPSPKEGPRSRNIVVRSNRVADVPEDRRSLPVLKWHGGLSRQRKRPYLFAAKVGSRLC